MSISTKILPNFLFDTERVSLSNKIKVLKEFPIASKAPSFHNYNGKPEEEPTNGEVERCQIFRQVTDKPEPTLG
jgi:hypothetical protein